MKQESMKTKERSVFEWVQVILAFTNIFISLAALFVVQEVIARDDATSILLKGEAAFKNGQYEIAYERFSSALLYDSPIAKAYLGYMNSNGLGCEEKNIFLGTEQYQEAINLGYSECKNNLIYNIIGHSVCYYEIAEMLLLEYEYSNLDVIAFLLLSINHPYFSNHQEDYFTFSMADLQQAEGIIEQYFNNFEGDRTEAMITLLQSTVIENEESTYYIELNYPQLTISAFCRHEICSSDAENRLYYYKDMKTVFCEGRYMFSGTICRNSFMYQTCFQQKTPRIS